MLKAINACWPKLAGARCKSNAVSDLLFILSGLNLGSIIDIFLVTLVFFGVLKLIQGTQAVQVLRGILIFAVLAVIAASAFQTLTAFSWLIDKVLPALLVAIPIIFQPELRRALERLGRTSRFLVSTRQTQLEETIEAVSEAAIYLSQIPHGALIVFERETGLEDYIETGVRVDAAVSADLLSTVFYPGTILHDGGVIIRNNRIVAAATVLPLGGTRTLTKELLGTRHRAALGITETTDAVAVVVSEETGIVSVAHDGHLLRHLDKRRLEQVLRAFFKRQLTDTNPNEITPGHNILKRLGFKKSNKPRYYSGNPPAGSK